MTVAPRRTARSLRIEAARSGLLLGINLALGGALILSTALASWWLGPRDLAYRSGPNTTTYILDESIVVGIVFGVFLPLVALTSITGVAILWAPRRDPPLPPAAIWANQSLVTFVYPFSASLYLATWWAWRVVVPERIVEEPSTAVRALQVLSPCVLLGGLAWAAALDFITGRANRYANAANAQEPPDVRQA